MTDTENTEPAARSGPTLAGLARELDVSISRAAGLVTQAGEPLHQVWYGTEVIAPEIADLARRLHRDTDPERPREQAPQGITVRDLALELYQPTSTTIAQASAYSDATGRDPYQARATWIGDWVLTPQAAQWIRRPLRESEPSSAQLPVSGPCSVPGQPREAAQAASPDPEDVASLLIRQDMRNADPVESRGATDQKIMAWAVRTAGHRFDQHTLWDYDLVTDAEHVYKCITHRHTGPNTRGPVRRG